MAKGTQGNVDYEVAPTQNIPPASDAGKRGGKGGTESDVNVLEPKLSGLCDR